MKMEKIDYLKILEQEIHSVITATVDEEGLPVTRAMDIMLTDEEGVYFLTARGKAFYKQLMEKKYVAMSGMTGGDGTMSKKAISLRGKVESIGQEKLELILEKNPYMTKIYPTKESQMVLEVFRLYEGQGEYFDLSTKPITRAEFSIGSSLIKQSGYFITDKCNGCGKCDLKCPQKCITLGRPSIIQQEHCLHCGNCMEVCPLQAVEKR